MEVGMSELMELCRRAFDSGRIAQKNFTDSDKINKIKEVMLMSLCASVQENDKFTIPETFGKPLD